MSLTMAEDALAQAQADVRRVRLTDRWTPLKPHPIQQLYFWHPAPIKVNPSGRRSGKTELCKRKAVTKLLLKRPWNVKIMLGAPTYDQAHAIFWEDIKALIPPWWIAGINESRMEIRTKWGAMLRVMGLNVPARAEGIPWDWMGIDELANCPPGLLDVHLLPALGTLGRTPSCDLIGVPDFCGPNQAEYERYWERGLLWPKYPKICSFHWPSSDILEPEKIAEYKSMMDEIQFNQEFGGLFVTSDGKALPNFRVDLHVDDDYCDYDYRLPLDWSLDFGVGTHACALLCQTYKGHVWIMDEIICNDGSTDVQVLALKDRCGQRGYSLRRLRRFGDAAGNFGHSNIGTSDYKIIDQMMSDIDMERMELKVDPAIKDTLNAVRGRLVTADNIIHLHIHSRCKQLIEACKTAPWPSKLEEFHPLACLRYYCYRLFGGNETRYSTGKLALPSAGG